MLNCNNLAYNFPTLPADLIKSSLEFKSVSSNGAIKGCVAAIDGFLLKIQTPAANETGNVKKYYLGHYCRYGINIQAACDYRCRFVSVCVAAPGGVNDITAFRKTGLADLIKELPIGKFVVGDCAYVCSEHLLTPFAGHDKLDAKQSSYNFYISQMRIRIEMVFGLMTKKWQILCRPMQTKLGNTGKVFMCITQLHNYCILLIFHFKIYKRTIIITINTTPT